MQKLVKQISEEKEIAEERVLLEGITQVLVWILFESLWTGKDRNGPSNNFGASLEDEKQRLADMEEVCFFFVSKRNDSFSWFCLK